MNHASQAKPLTSAELTIISNFFNGKEIETVPLDNETQQTFGDLYEFIGYNGMGSFGIVVKVIEKQTGELYAIKVRHSPGYQKDQQQGITNKKDKRRSRNTQNT